MAYKKTLTKEERQQKQDEYEREVADLFIKAIKENKAPWTKPWEPGVNVLDYNMFNMTSYSAERCMSEAVCVCK